ncbi:MAG: pilus assembly protein [Rhodocyclaceae bacterium]|nr:pilus assembly protein [Rhodocyclaceae bacterium]
MATMKAIPRQQHGAAATEFALVSVLFLSLVIAVMEFGRLAYTYTTAVEATRYGARLAVVCSKEHAANIKAKMKSLLPLLGPENITISYPATSCSAATCDPVTVSIQNVTVKAVIPLVPLSFPIPAYATSLSAESLDSTDNDVCT